jgi:DNA mismatch repair protein MutS
MGDDISPIRRQYLEVKKRYPDAVVFFRLGDFYETFDTDAEVASRELDIVLTSRNVAKGVRVPMAGIPFHAAEGYIAKLIQHGHHVAICEQVGDSVNGLMPREVVRVITPGTVDEPVMLSPRSNNYLAAGVVQGERIAFAYADITTGEFRVVEFETPDPLGALRNELARINPSETLLVEGLELAENNLSRITRLPSWRFELGRCEQTLCDHFEAARLEGFGLGQSKLAVRAAAVILQYLREAQVQSLRLLTDLAVYQLADFMILDAATRRGLELIQTLRSGEVRGSLLGVLDHTVTSMGARLLQRWLQQPLLDLEAIRGRQEAVEAFLGNGLARAAFREKLAPLADLERLASRVLSGHSTPRDLVSLRSSLRSLPGALEAAAQVRADPSRRISEIDPCGDLLSLLDEAIADDPPALLSQTGVIRPGFSKELDETIDGARVAREWIANLEGTERGRTGIRNLKVGYNKVFGYFIEVSRTHANLVPAEYIRKQTLVNAERYITPQMKDYETAILNAEGQIREIEARLFRQVCEQIGAQAERILATARSVAEQDVLSTFAENAARFGYVRPEVVAEDELAIRDGRHPVVEQFLSADPFVPNNAVLEPGERIRVITGPNMAGKSTYLRQVALICLMAQVGSFVPAVSARIGLVDRIFTRIGAQDELHTGQSTFMIEMIEAAQILHNATRRSLLIFDEVGRGTSTYDGVSIAWAVIEFIHNHPRLQSRTLFATHYHELIRLADLLPMVRNYNVAVVEEGGKVVFLHRIIPGGADRSYGIHVAQLAGMPRPVIGRAEEILQELESNSRGGKGVSAEVLQLPLLPESDPLLQELRNLDVTAMTPLDALTKLFEWQKRFASRHQ